MGKLILIIGFLLIIGLLVYIVYKTPRNILYGAILLGAFIGFISGVIWKAKES